LEDSTDIIERMREALASQIEDPFDLVYWLCRWFIDSDQYGGVGRETERMLELAAALQVVYKETRDTEESERLSMLHEAVRAGVLSGRPSGTKKEQQLLDLVELVGRELVAPEHYLILALALKRVLVPVNMALENIPGKDDDTEHGIVRRWAEAVLAVSGPEGVGRVIDGWDRIGLRGALAIERMEVVTRFRLLRQFLSSGNIPPESADSVLSAFVQEYERRVAQKRKGRGGRSLETVTSFLTEHFSIPTSEVPEHLTQALEFDRVVRNRKGERILISCKRTLRERWKQTDTANVELLRHYGVQELWQLVTHDHDLSPQKMERMGTYMWKFYLPEDSPRYLAAKKDSALASIVRPLSNFIYDLWRFQGNTDKLREYGQSP